MNQYRCETCKHAKIETTHYEDVDDTRIYCWKIGREIYLLTCEQPHWFFDVGCASHSDFNPQAEREKVMGKVMTILNEEIGLENLPVVTRRLQGLREGKDGE